MEKLIIAGIVLALVQCQSAKFSCFARGFYCANDLSGYYQCSLIKGTLVQGNKTNCPVGTKCSCFIRTKCTVPKSQICKKNPPPPILSEEFDYTFYLKIDFDFFELEIKIGKTKRVIRRTNRTWVRSWNMKTLNQTFEVIIPSGKSFLTVSFIDLIVLLCFLRKTVPCRGIFRTLSNI